MPAMASSHVCVAFMAVVATICCAAAADPANPVFPGSYSSHIEFYADVNGQVQTASSNVFWSQGATLNATAYIGTAQSTIHNYDEQKIYYIQGSNCNCYCDMQGDLQCNLEDSLCTYDYKNSGKFVGTSMRNGTKVNEYDWAEDLGPIPMNTIKLYVDASNNAPVFQYRFVEPFGKPAGYENTTWVTFVPGQPALSNFNVPNKKYCERCDESQCSPGGRR